MKNRPLHFISSLEELRYEKKRLSKKADKRLKKIKKRLNHLKGEITPTRLMQEAMSSVGVQSNVLPLLLPLVLKYRKVIANNPILGFVRRMSRKKLIIGSLSIIAAALAGYFMIGRMRRSAADTDAENPIIMGDEGNDADDLFV